MALPPLPPGLYTGRMIRPAFAIATLVLASCGNPALPDAKKTAALITANDKSHPEATNAQCKLFTADEAGKYIGEPVGPGRNATGGCQWLAKDESGDVIVSVVPAEYHEQPSMQEGYRVLPDVGTKGFVAPYMGGWLAGAIQGKQAIRVSVAGSGATQSAAIELLKESMKRQS